MDVAREARELACSLAVIQDELEGIAEKLCDMAEWADSVAKELESDDR